MIGVVQKAYGFTLLEAIVALALLSATGMAIFAMVQVNLLSLRRLQVHTQQDNATQIALEWMQQINPMKTSEGEVAVGGFRLQWEATLLEPVRGNVSYPRGMGLYQVGLYETRIRLWNEQTPLVAFNVRQVGYQKIRTPQPLFE